MNTAPVRAAAVRRTLIAASVALVCVLSGSGCASRGSVTVAGGRTAPQPTSSAAGRPSPPAAKRSASVTATTLESSDARLTAALIALAAVPSAATHRLVAREYLRLGVRDMAHEHFTDAVKLDPRDAESLEALARIWRDWGTSHLGLGDAYRAVDIAPRSSSAANTLGTLLQALGRLQDARTWYERALALDAGAWYALNNICYVEILTKQERAVETCRAAVRAAGAHAKTPENNLAIAYAAAGDLPLAKQWFRRAGDTATAHYNYGITLMAVRDYAEAVTAFEAALFADPQSRAAADRLRQARNAAFAEE